MSAESEFLAEIIANPRDLTPRLIYADWLEENGDPRGEFIRIQCELAEPSEDYDRRERLDSRQEELLHLHEREWTEPIREIVTSWTFRCGFVESVLVSAVNFLRHEQRIRSFAPIRGMIFTDCYERLQGIIKRPSVPDLESFRVERSVLVPSDIRGIEKVKFERLRTIHFVDCRLTDDSFEPLLHIQSDHLRDADFSINRLRNSSVAAIADSPVYAGLHELNLMANEIRQKGAIALAQSAGLKDLKYLEVRGNKIGVKGLEPLVRRFGETVRI